MIEHEMLSFLLAVAVLLGAARIFGEISRKFGQPSVLGEILAGIALGPSLLGMLLPEVNHWLFPTTGSAAIALDGLTFLSITLFLLVAGMEVDLSTAWRQGKAAMVTALFGMLVPFAVGYSLVRIAPEFMGFTSHTSIHLYALFFATALSISALPVIAKTLMDLNLYRSDFGMVVIGAAVLNDLVGWTVFAIILGLMGSAVDGNLANIFNTVALVILFTVFVLTIGRWAINRSLPWIKAYTTYPGGILGFAVTLGLLSAAFTEWAGVHAIFGAFILGIALGDSRHLRERTRATLDQFISFIFAPLFFASIGLRVNFVEHFDILLVITVLIVGTLTKVGGCLLGNRLIGMSWRDSWAVGFAMNSRGAMEIILSMLALQMGLIGDSMFVALVILALMTSATSATTLQAILRRNKKVHFQDFASSKTFLNEVNGTTMQEVIREMVEHMSLSLRDIDARDVLRKLLRREKLMSTALDRGVAVPHARILHLREPIVCIGVSRRGVECDSLDGNMTHLFIMILTPQDDNGVQLDILADVGGLFRDQEISEEIFSVRNYTEFLAEITQMREKAKLM
ncbi:cation:proton antiporter [Chrysiogenes arsenatis]|uniref:cation:proton antiporter domain-containing protein n=1 Tax=Chrysiogenes arsenatis TaxID=309797 RepID=UPI00041D6FD0|nr:cation:proton antiporter [Chrysiogenes arsenatis]